MDSPLTVRISLPVTAKPGEILEIKTLITHPMETGFRRDSLGVAIPRNILTRFECIYAGRIAFAMSMHPGVAANPYIAFSLRADVSGSVVFRWTDQHGSVTEALRELSITT